MNEHYRLDVLPEWDSRYTELHDGHSAEQRDAWIMLACVRIHRSFRIQYKHTIALQIGLEDGLLTAVPPHLNGE